MSATEGTRVNVRHLSSVVAAGRVEEAADLLEFWLEEEWRRGYDSGQVDSAGGGSQ